jgi:prepilin-type N-terminal cleavage/methylation domain-containing protein
MVDPRRLRSGGHDRDSGFTLVELVIVTMVLGIVTTALTGTLMVFLRNSDDLPDKLAASRSALLTTRYLPADLQSVKPGGVTTAGFTPVCGLMPDVLALSWTDFATTPNTRYDAIYRLDGGAITRTLCVNDVVRSSMAVAHDVATATATLIDRKLVLSVTTTGTGSDPHGLTYSIFGSRRS